MLHGLGDGKNFLLRYLSFSWIVTKNGAEVVVEEGVEMHVLLAVPRICVMGLDRDVVQPTRLPDCERKPGEARENGDHCVGGQLGEDRPVGLGKKGEPVAGTALGSWREDHEGLVLVEDRPGSLEPLTPATYHRAANLS